jgi:pimeloyl-ACP methyl ester carboxylesterase
MAKLELSDGLRIHYTQAGDGPDLVLIHGLTGNLAVWHLEIASGITSGSPPMTCVATATAACRRRDTTRTGWPRTS